MVSPVSPVIANIYMEYFEEMALGHQCPIPTPWWKRYVDDVIGIVKKEQVDTLFTNLNLVDPQIKFMMEAPAVMVVSHSWIPKVLPIWTLPYIAM